MKLRNLIWIKYEFIISHVWIHLESITIALLWIHVWIYLEYIVIPYESPMTPLRIQKDSPLWIHCEHMISAWTLFESIANPVWIHCTIPSWIHYEPILNPERFHYQSIVNHMNSFLNSVWIHYESIYDSGMDSSWLHLGWIWDHILAGRIHQGRILAGRINRATNSSS